MSFYESTFITRADLSQQEVERLTDYFSKVINDNGGKVLKTEYWGLRNLAYIIKKSRKGHYVMIVSDSPDQAIKEVDRRMQLNEDILRNMIVRVDEVSMDPSFMMSSQTSDFEVESVIGSEITEEDIEE